MTWLYYDSKRHALPAVSAAEPGTQKLPSWPAASIVVLEVLAAIAPAGLVTGMNIYLLILALVVWTASRERFDPALLRVIAPFIAIIVIGLGMGAGADLYLYFKDLWYVTNAAISLSVGYVLFRCKPDLARGLRAFIVGGTLVALLHLFRVAMNPSVLMLSAVEIRERIGYGETAPVLAFIILFAYFGNWRNRLKLSNALAVGCLLICTASMVIGFSRSNWIIALIGVIASLGAFSRREWLRLSVLAVIGLAALAALQLSVDTQSNAGHEHFLGKLARSLDEMHIEEYSDVRSINANWRGYETARALKHYASGSILQWVFGFGFGAQVDIGLAMPLGVATGGERGGYMRSIPVFHNGYIYLLIKGGAMAVVLFGYALSWLYVVGRRLATVEVGGLACMPARLLQAVTLGLVFATWIVGGVFNKAGLFPFLLSGGFLLAALTCPSERAVR
jgi:O-Antigen ligase